LWRWSEGEGAAEVYWARIELSLGEWTDISRADYEAEHGDHTYWALPTRDSYFEDFHGGLA
jgi:hypothetical protein